MDGFVSNILVRPTNPFWPSAGRALRILTMNESPSFLPAGTRQPKPDGCGHSPELIRLWDGRDHCAGCVEAAAPGLLDLAKRLPILEDSIPYDQDGGMRTWWTTAGLFFGALALVSVGFLAVLDRTGTLILVSTMALALGFGCLASLPSVFKARHVLPSVRVQEGLVEIFRPIHGEGKTPMTAFRLADAHWRIGKLQEDSYCRGRGGAIVADQRVVILRAPRKWAGVTPPSEFTAVGSSPEMVRIWVAFLKLAGVPESP